LDILPSINLTISHISKYKKNPVYNLFAIYKENTIASKEF